MYSAPPDLDRTALVGALRRHWGIDALSLDYLPVGFGSHHWEAVGADGSRWFVSADDLRNFMKMMGEGFRDNAPMTAAQAATVILDGVRKNEWRILVGEDAKQLDEAVRKDPWAAYAGLTLGTITDVMAPGAQS